MVREEGGVATTPFNGVVTFTAGEKWQPLHSMFDDRGSHHSALHCSKVL